MVYKSCEYCNIGFETARFHSDQKFCSKKCKNTVHRNKLKERIPDYQKDYFKRYWIDYYKENKEKFKNKIKVPEMIKAHNKLNNVINYNQIKIKLICSLCNSTENLDKHHPDYNKPFDFIVLCRSCHVKLHNKLKLYNEAGI